MATLENTQILVLVDSVQDRDEPHNEQQVRGERTPLLGTTQRRYGKRLKSRRCCVKSKAALLVLCWNLLVTLSVGHVIEYGSALATAINYVYIPNINELQSYAPAIFGFLALLYLFYPLAGCLADIRCGKYKTISISLWFIIWSGVFTCAGNIILFCYSYEIISLQTVSVTVLLAIGFGISTFFGIILFFSSYISFSANIIQFGMDQLHDSPSEDSVLFIHWFVFTSHLGAAINKFVVISLLYVYFWHINIKYRYTPEYIAGIHATPVAAFVFLGISAWIARRKRQWFMIDSGSRNPYKLVYKVIKFAAQHKTPIRRSAFTYCEDELPSRMDLGKEKYGGPFTTEQVEDVKAFLGILQVLLTLGPMFTTDIAASNMLYRFSNHLYKTNQFHYILTTYFELGGLTEILIVVLLPLYLCLLRPFIHRYIPGMFKRIGLGMIIRLLSLLSVFIIDTIGHTQHSNKNCFIERWYYEHENYHLGISVWFLTFPYILNALSVLFFYTATYEFICAQSPHAMKGLLIGTFFTVKGVFQFLGITAILIPFISWSFNTSFPSCGFVYYLVNILVALIGLVAYTWVARRYQYRQRDEPDNIYRYAEEYYDRDQDELESTFDYSNDCDNLNVHTVN